MALNQSSLKSDLVSLFNQMKDSPMSEEAYADSLATIITGYILTAEVKSGIAVSTTGTAAAQTGQTTAKGSLE